ncbi:MULTISPECIES: hypothetical protein [Kitasatospora]|uniref:Uncharacterized protein n=1 Tax=Kitasatospora cineracea TaxID=88074 RepID=A0A3N4RZ96_9ACTN|nr:MULTISPECIES: hypothetical protein [Kitasatospora]ROR38366.1 hypothetical protein EDD39_6547 [Kitasatospora cineracea]RPE32090.1 hypothetical protein EDD38_0335 [Kitasatospora cineracea]WAL74336.1 hypothetical protein OU787_24260 [Kitasatospora sp. YST-16]WNW40402.1 hypothetical protein RKE32_24220 [Streptomyces sp. Li-HN-5-13]
MFTEAVRALASCQRAVIVALALLPVLLVTAACLPAVLLLPAFPGGVRRLTVLLAQLRRWTGEVLTRSQPGSAAVRSISTNWPV